jgi:MurNAc alpha-1-phosphate uridylyltransferase
MILAAGKGTRLAPLTDNTPKPMLELAGKPLIEAQVTALSRAGVTEIVINLHHLGEQISDHLGDGARFGVNILYSREPELLETGGGIVKALPLFNNEPFWLLNGDIWTDFDFSTMPRHPHARDLAHIVLIPTPSYRSTGDFEFADGHVTGRGDTYVYGCMAVLTPQLFKNARIAAFSLRDTYFDLIPQGKLGAQIHHGQWQDIGTVEQYHALAATLAS